MTATSTVYEDQFELQGAVQGLTAVSTYQLAQNINLQMTEGTSAALSAGQLLIDTKTANTKHLVAGDVVPVKFAKTGDTVMTDRRRLQDQRAPRELPGRRTGSSWRTSTTSCRSRCC